MVAGMKLDTQTNQTQHSASDCDTQYLSGSSTEGLIQKIPTRRYLDHQGVWTTDLEKAMAFRSIAAAVEHLRQLKLVVVQVVSTRNLKVCEVVPATDADGQRSSDCLALPEGHPMPLRNKAEEKWLVDKT